MGETGLLRIEIGAPAHRMSLYRLLLTYGIRFCASAGETVSGFLIDRLPVSADYLHNRIQTILLDGLPVDLPDQVRIPHSCTLSLSAAMPGLFGAAFRRSGRFGAMRPKSTSEEAQRHAPQSNAAVIVTVKCFNDVAASLGDALLKEGVVMDAAIVRRFWRRHMCVMERDCRWIRIDGLGATAQAAGERLSSEKGDIAVKVTSAD